MSALRDAARRRLELNPLTTSLGIAPQVHQTPNSAISSNSLSAPFGYNPSTYTPVSAARPYNPQQWLNSPSVASDAGTHLSIGRVQDTEVVTPAPPPYSPPRSQRASVNPGDDVLTSPASRLSPANLYRSSPEPASTPSFPPPPPSRTRAGSNDRPPAIFNISTFSRRTGHDPPRLSPEATRENAPAVRRPLPISVEPPSSSEEDQPMNADSRPPAARRAASAGAISTPSSSRSRGSSTTRWEPGMPLPPPPPGPPPQSRSQSMTRTNEPHLISPPTRRPPHLLSNLGPIPPTPAGWVDGHEDISIRGRSPSKGLHIDTESASSSTVANDLSNSGSSSSGLARTHAVRGEPKSIRERRTESKTRKSAVAPEEPSNNPWAEAITPSDIVVPPTVLGRRPTITRSTPRSARFTHVETPQSGEPSEHPTPIQARTDSGSRGSTPRPPPSSSRPEAPTPPFSPEQLKAALSDNSPAIPPKALPTPPQSRMSLSSPGRPSPSLLYIPNPESAAVPPPLVPSRPGSRQSSESQISQVSPTEQFARAAIERHQAFAQKEAAAKTDSERVRIFAEFIVAESRLRRDKYAGAIDAMGSEILELTRDLFRPYNQSRRESSVSRSSGWTPDSSVGPKSPGMPGQRSHRGSLTAALHDNPQFPQVERSSSSGPASPALARPESTWWSGYMPSLSPIPSMSVSEALDGSDSRGRPSSRWWEVSQEGRSEGAGSQKLERSKRESKYMGMPRELREALQYENGDPQTNGNMASPDAAGPSQKTVYGPNEYPPEKVGLHEQDLSSPGLQQTPSKPQTPYSATPITPNPKHLDVSRLVTLPPPYPRHHPAVNNNHPDLTSMRTIVRVLSDFTEVEATRSRFRKTSLQIQDDLAAEASKRRNSLRLNIQREIESGNMSFADAAKIEATAVTAAQEKEKEACKVDFELFQKEVVMPLNDLLMDRVARSTELFTTLRGQLFVDAQEQSPNLTQEEGDEQPELLEKLTLLKWVFEAREQLHRELFDLLSDRNNRYRDMVITPYRLAKNEEKIRNAETFFTEDASKRKLAFEQEVLKRTEEFMDIIEENVKRGVEVQLSAFWDIAPSLSRITEKIPKDLTNFQIQIPASEYEENPSYHVFPMQYLYSLLEHCEKSTYQFIESQTNLLCLLHEVKSGVTLANCRLMRTQRIAQGEDEKEVDRELKEVESDEEVRLTDDLKERVRCVEEQWSSSLGNELKGLRDRLMGFLMEQGGWDEDQ